MKRPGKCSHEGIALLIVIWVLTILMVAALSFSLMTRADTRATISFKEETERKFAAEAGIERGVMEVFYRKRNRGAVDANVWKTDGSPYTDKVGDSPYTVNITDDTGKIDINVTPEVILRNLLLNTGMEMETADTIVDSIMDWKDADDLTRLHGAESSYYMSLPDPYKAKNRNFDTLKELLLVKGMTPEILYGSGERKGIIHFLTVYSGAGIINVNAAPKEVLMAVPGVSSEMADAIIQRRDAGEIKSVEELRSLFMGNQAIGAFLGVGESNTFTIEAVGHKGSDKDGYAIRATVKIEGDDKYKYVYYENPAERLQ